MAPNKTREEKDSGVGEGTSKSERGEKSMTKAHEFAPHFEAKVSRHTRFRPRESQRGLSGGMWAF